MRRFTVLAERFAVIGGDHDHRAVERVRRLQPGEQHAEHRVGVGDFGVVRRAAVMVLGGRLDGACGSNRCTQANHC